MIRSIFFLVLAFGSLTIAQPTFAQKGAVFASKRITSKTPDHAVDIEAKIKGAKQLFLLVTDGGDGFGCDWANWAEPRLIDAEGHETKLTSLKWTSAETDWQSVHVDKNVAGQAMRINGEPVAYGIGTHANSTIVYKLPKGHRFVKFVARGGLDDGGTRQQGGSKTSVQFMVFTKQPPKKFRSKRNARNAIVPMDQDHVPLSYFTAAHGLEVTLWAKSPLLMNPTNMDIDRHGRIWIAEGLNYRGSRKRPEGDRIVVLEDTDGDGKADKSHTFVQDKELVSPLGIAVIGNLVIVSQPPNLIVYTDVNGDAKFDPEIDKRENLLTGFGGKNHDHSLHSVTVHPNGRYVFNHGNMGSNVTDRSGRTFHLGSPYSNRQNAGKPSADGHVYIGGASFTVNPDGTGLRVIGHNYRNSYEQTVTSFGDVFQNDNDDPPACRTSWVMEYANFGFASMDGKRSWGADRRPGQSTPIAEWRQQDPGTTPPGDVYGGGAPTGIVYYENGALGKHTGLLLSCESAKNVVFGYYPVPHGAGFRLERFDFLTTNLERDWAGADFRGGRPTTKNLFRPSDVSVGPDGAIYVADWFDARVGGHSTRDTGATGSIYRIAPKGFTPKVPQFDLATLEGQLVAFGNPAPNVRALGFYKLRAQGQKAVPAVRRLLTDKNPYLAARAVYLLAQLGESGVAEVVKVLDHADAQMRIVAFRALRHMNHDVLAHARKLVVDKSPAVRREVALALRDVPFKSCGDLLIAIAAGYDGKDRWSLEALGTAASGKIDELYAALRKLQSKDPTRWSPAFASIAWRLHPAQAVADLKTRANSKQLTREEREQAVDSLAFIPAESAGRAMLAIATDGPADTFKKATWWVRNRHNNDWRSYNLAASLPARPKPVAVLPKPKGPVTKLPPVSEILKLKGVAKRGKGIFEVRGTCFVCHAVKGKGGLIGPDLTDIAQKLNTALILENMINPSANISLGYEASVITKKDGTEVLGFVVGEGDPLLIRDASGVQHAINKKDLVKREKMKQSLMPAANLLGLKAQDLADIVAYLRSLK